MSITITLGRTIKENGGSYRKTEITVTKEIEPTRGSINRQFAVVRQAIDEQLKIDEGEKSPSLC